MENGAVIYIEAAWALNTLDVGEARTFLSGTKAGADMVSDGPFTEGLRINTVVADKTAVLKPDVGTPRGRLSSQAPQCRRRTWKQNSG